MALDSFVEEIHAREIAGGLVDSVMNSLFYDVLLDCLTFSFVDGY